jgi:hypothetical protein
MLPAIAADGLADAVDAFCEHIAFSPEETAQFFSATRALGFPVRLHADQLSDLGGATLGARFSALSADHLGYANDAGRGCYGPLPALPLCSCRGLSISFASGDFRQSMRSVFTACRSRSRLIAIPAPRR